jgi:preprotein translocase subunit SecG
MEIHPALIHFFAALGGFWFFILLALGVLMAAQENKLNKNEVKIWRDSPHRK